MRRRFVVALIAMGFVLIYPVAGFIGGLIPCNAGWAAPDDGIAIYIESNGIHVGIVLPKVAAGVDLRPIFSAGDLADPRYGRFDHVSIGWGERDFYIGTPTWRDLKFSTVLAAAVGSDRTLVHVDHVPQPVADGEIRRLVVRPEEYRRLVAYVRASLVAGGERHRGYYRYDVFYAARGRYSAAHTCNAWVGDALRYAGIRVGAWTPFPSTVMRWFPRHA